MWAEGPEIPPGLPMQRQVWPGQEVAAGKQGTQSVGLGGGEKPKTGIHVKDGAPLLGSSSVPYSHSSASPVNAKLHPG